MRRHRRIRGRNWPTVLAILLIPLAFISVGYAMYSQNLSINSTGTIRPMVLTPDLVITYDDSSWGIYKKYYNLNPITITNQGNGSATNWSATFKIPSDATNFQCSGADCTVSGDTVTVNSNPSNSYIAAGQSFTFSASFSSYTSGFDDWQMTVTTDTLPSNGGPMTPPTVTITPRGAWGFWGLYYSSFDGVITNTRETALDSWQITVPFSGSVWSMSGASYNNSGSILTITGGPIPANGTAEFSTYMTLPYQGWNFNGYSIEVTP
ncbi:hypothetical protein CR969_00210 [Candidatus Saccharibacteria bacterium]|nr:MAG: hypothetical protein CR969_00210 [Candidatus Saccharibacteria bacterium]